MRGEPGQAAMAVALWPQAPHPGPLPVGEGVEAASAMLPLQELCAGAPSAQDSLKTALHTTCFRFCAKPEIDPVEGGLRRRLVSPGQPEDGTPYELLSVLRETGNRSGLRGTCTGDSSAHTDR